MNRTKMFVDEKTGTETDIIIMVPVHDLGILNLHSVFIVQ